MIATEALDVLEINVGHGLVFLGDFAFNFSISSFQALAPVVSSVVSVSAAFCVDPDGDAVPRNDLDHRRRTVLPGALSSSLPRFWMRGTAAGSHLPQLSEDYMTKLSDGLETRLAELEQRNAALEQKNAALEQRLKELEPKPAPKPTQHRPVTIVSAMPTASADALPDAEQFVELQRIVWRNSRVSRRMANAARRLTNSMRNFSGVSSVSDRWSAGA